MVLHTKGRDFEIPTGYQIMEDDTERPQSLP